MKGPGIELLNVLAAVSAITAIIMDHLGNTYWFAIAKPATTCIIIAIPVLYGNRAFKKYGYLTIMALVFCVVGDVFLLYEDKFIWGLGAFLIAHCLFLGSFVAIDGFKPYPVPLVPLVLFGALYFTYIHHGLKELTLPVLLYVVCISLMCWQGLSLYIWKRERAFGFMAVAVLLFMFSDAVIAFNKFMVPFKLAGVFILATYWLSIALLANATVAIKE